MDICRNISVSGGTLQYHQQLPESHLGTLDDLFSGHPLEEEGDVNMEWLSTFMEECLSSTGNCLLPPPPPKKPTQSPPSSLQLDKLVHIPVKGTRSKRKRSSNNSPSHATRWWSPPPVPPPKNHLIVTSDPPLLQQAYWLADSELILPQKQQQKKGNNTLTNSITSIDDHEDAIVRKRRKKKNHKHNNSNLMMAVKEEEEGGSSSSNSSCNGGGMRRCSHCLSQRTPQWRAGPLGPKTLCNACGVRYKSGRLLPEYRPAKSPSFISFVHSNSHKKVLEMRTLSLLSSDNSSSSPSSS